MRDNFLTSSNPVILLRLSYCKSVMYGDIETVYQTQLLDEMMCYMSEMVVCCIAITLLYWTCLTSGMRMKQGKENYVPAIDATCDKMESFAPAKDAVNMENIGLCPGKQGCRHGWMDG
jgi:hypothetical protein